MRRFTLFSVAMLFGGMASLANASPTVLKTTNLAQTVDEFVIWDNLSGPDNILFESQANGAQVTLNGTVYTLSYTPTATYIRIYLVGGGGNDIVVTTGVSPTGRTMSVYVHLDNGDDNFANNASYTVSAYGGDGDDVMEGGPGTDLMRGNDGNDVLEGNDGPDYLNGGAGDDDILGGAGNDNCIGGAGADTVNGQEGDDMLVGGIELSPGVWGPDHTPDLLEGESGADAFHYRFQKKNNVFKFPKITVATTSRTLKLKAYRPYQPRLSTTPKPQLQSFYTTVEEDVIVDFNQPQGDTKVSVTVQ